MSGAWALRRWKPCREPQAPGGRALEPRASERSLSRHPPHPTPHTPTLRNSACLCGARPWETLLYISNFLQRAHLIKINKFLQKHSALRARSQGWGRPSAAPGPSAWLAPRPSFAGSPRLLVTSRINSAGTGQRKPRPPPPRLLHEGPAPRRWPRPLHSPLPSTSVQAPPRPSPESQKQSFDDSAPCCPELPWALRRRAAPAKPPRPVFAEMPRAIDLRDQGATGHSSVLHPEQKPPSADVASYIRGTDFGGNWVTRGS